jgi:hypothetical protein
LAREELRKIIPKAKKRLSKNAKAAQKLLNDSKLFALTKAAHPVNPGDEFRSSVVTPGTSEANKERPHKKRG